MTLPPNLVADLRRVLGAFRAANGFAILPTAPGKALEAWTAMRLADAARRSGKWRVTLRGGDGARLAPGQAFALPSVQGGVAASNAGAPGFVRLRPVHQPRSDLELHVGLQWKGRSHATHECDVSVLPASIADGLRRAGGGWPHGLPIVAFECKDKTTAGTPDEMRQTLSRLFDLVLVTRPPSGWSCRIFEHATPSQWGRRRSTYRASFEAGAFGIVRVGAFQRGAKRLGRHYHIGRHGGIYTDPGAIAIVEGRFLDAIDDADLL